MGGGREEKPDKPKVAEQGRKPTTTTRPDDVSTWGLKKPMQFFEAEGYLRVRSDVFYKLHLGLRDQTGSRTSVAPFTRPLSAYAAAGVCPPGSTDKACGDSALMSTNLRFRFEPTFNVHSKVRIRMTVDVLDNLVLGSTPESYSYEGTGTNLGIFSGGQSTPQAGRNALYDAIQIKHVWGEVDLPFGQLTFGRMPAHWGTGMLVNGGTCRLAAAWTVDHKGDPDRCLDSDYGSVSDRIMFTTRIPVVNLFAGFAWDFGASGPISHSLSAAQIEMNPGQPYNLDPRDDMGQWVAFLGRIDSPLEVKDRLTRDQVVFNYGTYWVFRRQTLDFPLGVDQTLLSSTEALASKAVYRRAFTMTPDIWLRLNWKKLQVEFEGALTYGWIRNLGEYAGMVKPDEMDYQLLQYGWVLRGHYTFLRDALHIGLEVGMASGDDMLEGKDSSLNYRTISMIPRQSDRWNTLHRFDPNYRVDLIFFREIMGTVHNAGYLKPTVMYHILKELTARVDMIYSWAMEPVATPGNKPSYGVEIDADVEYRWPEAGFAAGIAYGVFIPLQALDRPAEIYGFKALGKTAQTVQLRASIKF
jgi:uncharacterized protein (TIGR04551 family)